MANPNQEDSFRIVIEGIVDQVNASNPNVVYNAYTTFVGTTIPGLGAGIKVLAARYGSTVYPKPGETTTVPAGLGNS